MRPSIVICALMDGPDEFNTLVFHFGARRNQVVNEKSRDGMSHEGIVRALRIKVLAWPDSVGHIPSGHQIHWTGVQRVLS